MSISRQELSRLHCSALISEYLNYRDTLWGSSWQKLKATFSNHPSERKTECEDLIKKIYAASTLTEKTEIIDLAGKISRKAQESKETAINSVPKPMLHL